MRDWGPHGLCSRIHSICITENVREGAFSAVGILIEILFFKSLCLQRKLV